ncbi:MAG: phosphoribosylformylglycinamidine synthase I [Candidatus Magasanikbacteria bacterium]|nr:phosphoribosylformylglycinamidine synthase I [Candidatus Magasanikbacteria bacterium]
MKIAIIQFPGSNAESESFRAVKQAGMDAEEFLWNRDYHDLMNFDGYFIVGGFSYEDRSRSGIIASLDPLMVRLKPEAEKGKPILGVCNGAQILVETGLVPGLKNYALGMALAENWRLKNGIVVGTGFYNTWINIKQSVQSESSAFTRHLKNGEFMHVPVAHGEGRFIIPEELLAEMIDNHQTVFRYCDEAGNISAEFPINPNGAEYNLAAVTNPAGNVMAIMPHPERTDNGQPIFTSMREYIQEKIAINVDKKIEFTPPPLNIQTKEKDFSILELPVELLITDNEAATVQNALKNLGINVVIKRYVHWEIKFPESTNLEIVKKQILDSGELFNKNKERLVADLDQNTGSTLLLVRYQDDSIGEYKKETLEKLGVHGIEYMTKGILWQITSVHDNINSAVDKILATHILFNPFSQECFKYE